MHKGPHSLVNFSPQCTTTVCTQHQRGWSGVWAVSGQHRNPDWAYMYYHFLLLHVYKTSDTPTQLNDSWLHETCCSSLFNVKCILRFSFWLKMAGLFRLFFSRKRKFIFRLFLFYCQKSKIHFRLASNRHTQQTSLQWSSYSAPDYCVQGWADLNQGDLNHWFKSRFKSNDFFSKKITWFKSYNCISLCNN